MPIEALEDIISQNLSIGYHNPGSGTADNFNSSGISQQSKKVFML